jgi:hypothetical protein
MATAALEEAVLEAAAALEKAVLEAETALEEVLEAKAVLEVEVVYPAPPSPRAVRSMPLPRSTWGGR